MPPATWFIGFWRFLVPCVAFAWGAFASWRGREPGGDGAKLPAALALAALYCYGRWLNPLESESVAVDRRRGKVLLSTTWKCFEHEFTVPMKYLRSVSVKEPAPGGRAMLHFRAARGSPTPLLFQIAFWHAPPLPAETLQLVVDSVAPLMPAHVRVGTRVKRGRGWAIPEWQWALLREAHAGWALFLFAKCSASNAGAAAWAAVRACAAKVGIV